MKSRHLFSLAALCAAFCMPCASIIHAENPVSVQTVDPASLSADQFVQLYLGTNSSILSADGSPVTQFVWYTQVNEANARALAESQSIFERLPQPVRQAVLMACNAHAIDYAAFVNQAKALCAQMDAIAAQQAAEAAKQARQEPAAQTPAPEQPAAAQPSQPAAPSQQTPAQPQTPVQEPAATPQTPVQNPAASGEQPAAPADSAVNTPADSSSQPSVTPVQPDSPADSAVSSPADSSVDPSAEPSADAADPSENEPAKPAENTQPTVSDPAASLSSDAASGWILNPNSQAIPDALLKAPAKTDEKDADSSQPEDTNASSLASSEQPKKTESSAPADSAKNSQENPADSADETAEDENGKDSESSAPVRADVLDRLPSDLRVILNDEELLSQPADKDADSNTGDDKAGSGQTNDADSKDDSEQQPSEPEKPAVPPIQSGAPTILQGFPKAETPDPAIVFNGNTRPAGLNFEDYTDSFDPVTEQIIHALAAKSGFEIFEVHPVTYIFESKDMSASSSGIIKLSGNNNSVLFQILAVTENGADVLVLTDNSCSYDEASGVLNLAPAGEIHLEIAGIGTPAEEPVVEEQPATDSQTPAEDNKEEPKTDPSANASSEKQTDNPASPAVEDEISAPARSVTQTSAGSTAANTSAPKTDTAADSFINRYCYQSGMLIRQASSANYQQLLNGYSSWHNLSVSSRAAVNNFLTSLGAPNYPTLYRQANRVRLGLPLVQSAAGNSSQLSGWNTIVNPSVNTGAAEEAAFWIASCGISFEALLYGALRPRRKEEDDE